MVGRKFEAQNSTINHLGFHDVQISIFDMDNVALNGNAMLFVLRNTCRQSIMKNVMQILHKLPLVWNVVLFAVYGAMVLMVSIVLFQAFRLRAGVAIDLSWACGIIHVGCMCCISCIMFYWPQHD